MLVISACNISRKENRVLECKTVGEIAPVVFQFRLQAPQPGGAGVRFRQAWTSQEQLRFEEHAEDFLSVCLCS